MNEEYEQNLLYPGCNHFLKLANQNSKNSKKDCIKIFILF
jgi:hypothetical protein